MIVATSTQQQARTAQTRRTYPQRKRWDYIATPEEHEELEKLRAIRKAIAQSQAEFQRGEGIPATPAFFEELKKEARERFLASNR